MGHDAFDKDTPAGSHQLKSLDTLSFMCLIVSSISLAAAMAAFYWFMRMRRAFYHDLVMLLIQSDILKALWLVICPIVLLVDPEVRSKSSFCQVAGFFLTVAIEASDTVVLVIALHIALTMRNPRRAGGEAGLYPYRRLLYFLCYLIPTLFAAVVPISKGRFADNGAYCYLPIKPTWYRAALSWIPRYIVLGTILVSYAFANLYILFRFRKIDRNSRSTGQTVTDPETSRRLSLISKASTTSIPFERRRKVKVMSYTSDPPLTDHGLLPPPSVARGSTETRQVKRQSIVSFADPPDRPPPTPKLVHKSSLKWNTVDFKPRSYSVGSASHNSQRPMPETPLSEAETLRLPDIGPLSRSPRDVDPTPPRSPRRFSTPDDDRRQRVSSDYMTDIFTILRNGPAPKNIRRPTNAFRTPQTEVPSARIPSISLGPLTTSKASSLRRAPGQRALRLLFVYPLIYFLTWVAPFVSHILGYDDDVEADPAEPFSLQAASLLSLCIMAAVDSIFFLVWERPWNHLRGSFREGLAMRVESIKDSVVRSPFSIRAGEGWTRDEGLRDQRAAQSRKGRETATNKADAADARKRPARPHREWWDAEGYNVNFDEETGGDLAESSSRNDPTNRPATAPVRRLEETSDMESQRRKSEGARASQQKEWWDAFDDDDVESKT